jgi:hypothetical protein
MKFRLFYLDYPFKKRRIYLRFPSVLIGDFNRFEHKLCQTKPNSRKSKMNITNYIASSYNNNTQVRPTTKQSQTKPKFNHYKGTKSEQSQIKAIKLTAGG